MSQVTFIELLQRRDEILLLSIFTIFTYTTFYSSQPCYPGVECSLVVRQGNNVKDAWTMSIEYACGLCPDGMVGDGVHCSQTDPCESNPCYPGATCTMVVNFPASTDYNLETTTQYSGTCKILR